jgi:hypothetical protein
MERRTGRTMIAGVLLIVALVFFGHGTSYAKSGYKTSFESAYPAAKGSVIDSCTLCHTSTSGSAPRNPYGAAYGSSGRNFKTIEPVDSDGDGFSNLVEINAKTFPGDNTSYPAGDATKPVVTAFAIPANSSSLVVNVTVFTATDNVKVTGYQLTTSATAPLSTGGGWTALAPKNYTFPNQGSKTLYGWAKDAAGNVSLSKSAKVTITRTDTAKPVVTAFTAVASATAKVATISSFTATDNVKVTGYKVTETPAAPLAGAAGWSALPPKKYTSKTSGAKTLYGWAKDAAGNVSLSKNSGPISLAVVPPPAAQATAPASGSLMPLPAGQETFTYDTVETPVRSDDPASAMPVGVSQSGAGGDTLDIQVSIGKFEGPVNVYFTLYAPAENSSFAPLDVYSLQPDNTIKPLDMGQSGTAEVDPWKTNVTEANETVLSSMDGLPAGQYLVVLTVTSANNENVYYEWMTNFIVW